MIATMVSENRNMCAPTATNRPWTPTLGMPVRTATRRLGLIKQMCRSSRIQWLWKMPTPAWLALTVTPPGRS